MTSLDYNALVAAGAITVTQTTISGPGGQPTVVAQITRKRWDPDFGTPLPPVVQTLTEDELLTTIANLQNQVAPLQQQIAYVQDVHAAAFPAVGV